MATNQIFIESTYDEYRNNVFLKEFASDPGTEAFENDTMNMSPSIFFTSDSVANVVWETLGTFELTNALATIVTDPCILNPLLVSRNSGGVFDYKKTCPVIDKNNKPITDVELPVALVSFDGTGSLIFGFKDGVLTLYIGYIFSVQDVETFKISQQILVSDTIPGQRVSVSIGTDKRIFVLFINDSNNLDGLVSTDYGCTFDKVNIEEFFIDTVQSSCLNSCDNQQLTCITMDGEQDNNLFSCRQQDSFNLFTSIRVLSDVSLCYPGVYYDRKTYGSMYISTIQDKSNSANNSNIIVMRSDDGGLTFFKIKE